MSLFVDILTILSVSSGGIAYYLVVLFCIWAIMGLALSRWSRGEHRGVVPRLLIASGVMLFGRFVLFVIALIDRQNGTALVVFGPPIERVVDALSLVLLCWAFTATSRKQVAVRILTAIASLVFVGFYVISAMQWGVAWQVDSGLVYNLFWHTWVWEIGQLLCAISMLAYLFVFPFPERGTLIVSLGMLALGHLMQAVLPFADQIPHAAGWVRLANLVALPLISVSAFRFILQRFDAQLVELHAVSQESLSQVTGLMDLVDINRRMASSLNLDTVLKNALHSLSQITPTNLCAIAFVTRSDIQELVLQVIYDDRDVREPGVRFLAEDHPAIEYAITRNKPVILESGENGQATNIYRLLGSGQSGPLIIQPLIEGDAVTGLVMVGRPNHPKPFSAVEINKCETFSRNLALTICNARQYRALEQQHEHTTADLHLLEMEHARTRADLENRLKQSQNELSLYIQKLYETEISEQRAHNDVRELGESLNRLKVEHRGELERARSELQQSVKQTGVLTQKLGLIDAQRLELERRLQSARQREIDLQAEFSVLQHKRDNLEAQVAQLHKMLAEQEQKGQQNGTVDEQSQAKEQFVGSLAQELRTPMTSIVGYTELLLSGAVGDLDDMSRKFLRRVQANIERMGAMLNDLIGITTIDSGKLILDLETVDLRHLINEALGRAQFRLEEKELGSYLEIEEMPPIRADPDSLQQILNNLLSNACKSSRVGTEIKIKAHQEFDDVNRAFLRVSVSDTGGGVAPQDRPRVFDRFYRADDALIEGLGETGVGLSIVKSLVEAHQGRVWIESEDGVGSTFHFTMPFGLENRTGQKAADRGNGNG
ncbi:MAG: hypothetical protein JW934_12650 [Anaerolineae bacterium]|nr:hypothetical protein [Anaerolineae bacterium]